MLQLKKISKKYVAGTSEVNALSDVSLAFRNSEFVSILGPSGCGKTTLLNIIGGLDRGLDYTEFEKALSVLEIDNLVCLPETGHNIADNLAKIGAKANVYKAKDLPDAVDFCFEHTEKGKSCIMSPAAASYNYYRDFEEKGNHFKQLVKNKT